MISLKDDKDFFVMAIGTIVMIAVMLFLVQCMAFSMAIDGDVMRATMTGLGACAGAIVMLCAIKRKYKLKGG